MRAGSALAEARRIPGLAGSATVEPDWAPVAKRIRDEATDDWNDKVAVDRFTGKGGIFVRGTATITGPGQVRVGDQEFVASRGLVVATGLMIGCAPGADYRARPRVTSIDPEIGAVGLTEQQARDAGLDVRVGHVPLSSTSRGFIHGPGNEGFIKVVVDHGRGVVVGATTAGPAGGEMIGALSVAVHAEVPIATLSSAIWAYPTFHRGIGQALASVA
ncbi:hypothetical protein [Actinoplanes lutulentus]|uniref:hypothetical protein n=1 Tax=Actinoplanes lutulentus TaxID=1287878 RepID=UPI002889030C|nr:hypothetical protein [Actinoplanes lutulentus]